MSDFSWKTLTEIRTDLFTKAKEKLPSITNYNSGGVFRSFLEIVADGIYQVYVHLSVVLKQAYIQYATGSWLDLHVKRVNITRNPATKTTGTVYFTRTGSTGNVVIPAGTIVRTAMDSTGHSYRYKTDAEVVLADGTSEVAAAVTAEFEGAAYNVGQGTIVSMVSVVAGVEAVENRSDWITTEGADQETDQDLRERYWLKWEETAEGATKNAYIAYAKEVAGVIDVAVDDQFPRGPGTVDVYITGSAGLPTQALIDAVQAEVDDRKPICSDTDVKAPAAVPINPSISIEMDPGTATTGVQTDAENIINALFIRSEDYSDLEDLRFKIGSDVTEDAIIRALSRRIGGIKRVDCGFTGGMVAIDSSELATPGTVTVTVTQATEA